MINTTLSLGIGLLLILGIGGMVFLQTQNDGLLESADALQDTNELTDRNTTAETAAPVKDGVYTAEEIATHNSKESCWSSINGSVYDLTSWIPNHPGGEQGILRICGIDGTEKFIGKHGGAERQATILAGFKIGTLK